MRFADKVLRWATWEQLKQIASMKLFAYSSIFLFIIPVTAKVLSEMPDRIVLPLSHQELILNIKLPFKWLLLFVSALFVTIANIIYRLFCPSIIRLYQNYAEFESAGQNNIDLQDLVKEIVPSSISTWLTSEQNETSMQARQDAVSYIANKYMRWTPEDPRQSGIIDAMYIGGGQARMIQEVIPKAFVQIRTAAGYYRPAIRIVILLALIISLSCITLIFFQSLIWVVTYLVVKGV